MRRFATTVLAIALAGCTHASSAGPDNDPQLITAAEITESHASNAYDAIKKLHANFLSTRGKTTILTSASPLPVVYVDGTEYGGLDVLRNIPAEQVETIRLYRAWESGKFGSNRTGGVIEVVTKR